MSRRDINETFAVVLAGQVAAGLTRGDGQYQRMQGALTAIGLMLRNACPSQLVQDVLDLIERSEVVEHG